MSATTSLGTPASPKWDDDWLARVDRVEQSLGRRICGAHTPAWSPCKLSSTHANGRCRFHGGAPGIGAPGGNRNAWVHGLYSRRLQQCGDHCPLWRYCPMSGKDVLDTHPAERPHCVYEQEEYEATLSTFSLGKEKEAPKETDGLRGDAALCEPGDAMVSASCSEAAGGSGDSRLRGNDRGGGRGNDRGGCGSDVGEGSAFDVNSHGRAAHATDLGTGLVERNVALFQVMLSRAQAAIGVHRLTDDTYAYSSGYESRSTRVGALLQAQLHIARELRQWLKLLPGFDPRTKSARDATPTEPEPPKPKGLPDLMKPILEEAEVVFDELLGPGGFPGRGVPPPRSDPPPAPA